MNIYVLGNTFLEKDSKPIQILPKLEQMFPKINFIHVDPTGNWWLGDKHVVLIDSVQGLDAVTIFTSFDDFEPTQTATMHDYDLYMDLKIMSKIHKIDSFEIIGIPMVSKINLEDISNAIKQTQNKI